MSVVMKGPNSKGEKCRKTLPQVTFLTINPKIIVGEKKVVCFKSLFSAQLKRSVKLLGSVRDGKGAQEMLRCVRPPSPFTLSSALSSVPFSLWKLSLLSLALSPLQVTSVCVCEYVRNECVAPMSVYIVRRQLELEEAAKGSRRPPPTPPHSRVVSRARGDSPPLPSPSLPPSIPPLCSTSFSSWRTPPPHPSAALTPPPPSPEGGVM